MLLYSYQRYSQLLKMDTFPDGLGQYHRISNAETPRAAQGDTIGLGSDEGIVLSYRDGRLGSPES